MTRVRAEIQPVTGTESLTNLLPPDFEFQDFTQGFAKPGIYYIRPLFNRWGKEQVERFWVPVEDVILDTIVSQNQKDFEEIFSKIE